MNILLAAATGAEIALFKETIGHKWKQVSERVFEHNGNMMHTCITGVGMAATAYAVTKALSLQRFDLAIQAGIGGSFDRSIELGEVVAVVSEQYGDLGAEDHTDYIDIFHLGLIAKDVFPFKDMALHVPESKYLDSIALKKVNGLSVNTVTGNEASLRRLMTAYNCQVESMEGIAFHYVCLMEGVDFLQVRSISNYVEPRDRNSWKMKEAVQHLNDWLLQFMDTL